MDGCFDGTWKGTRYFTCKFSRGFFCPVSALKPAQQGISSSQQSSNTPPMYRKPTAQPHGCTAPAPGYRDPTQGSTMPASGYRDPAHGSTPVHGELMQGSTPLAHITVGTAVEVGDLWSPHYGTVQWIGNLPGCEGPVAGLEMVSIHTSTVYMHVPTYYNRRKSLNSVVMAVLMEFSISSAHMVELTSVHSHKSDQTEGLLTQHLAMDCHSRVEIVSYTCTLYFVCLP